MKRELPYGLKQLNVVVPEELLLELKERGQKVKGGMKEIVEEALRMYLKKGKYFLYTNEDEVSAEINDLKRCMDHIQKWCVSKGMEEIAGLRLATQEENMSEEVEPISKPHLNDGKGNQSYINICRYCGEEFIALAPMAFCSGKHKERYRA